MTRPLCQKSRSLQIKNIDESGIFTGYATVFHEPDQEKDIILPGAFQASLQQKTLATDRPKLLWQHDVSQPIGRWESIQEDEHGLFVKGRLFLKLSKARDVYTLLKEGEVTGLSIGFISQKKRPNAAGGDTIEALDLLEISLVTFPAHPKAQIQTVKAHTHMHPSSQDSATANQQHNNKEYTMPINLQNPIEKRPLVAQSIDHKDRGFSQFLRTGTDYQTKSLSTLEDSRGGHLIPEILHDRLLNLVEDLSPLRRLASTLQISSSSVDILLTHAIPEAGWAAEASDRDETDAGDVRKLSIPVHEIYACPRATQKLLDDAKVDVEAWLIRGVAEKIARMETNAFLKGDGNQKPSGLLMHARGELSVQDGEHIGTLTTGVDGAFPDQAPADLLIDLMQALPTKYLQGAAWLMSRSALAAIRKLKDQTSGQYLWQPGLEGTASLLLGYPVVLSDEMPMLNPGTASTAVVFGNFKEAYQIVDRSEVHILRDPYTVKPYVEFYVTKRVGGAVVNPNAVKFLNFSA